MANWPWPWGGEKHKEILAERQDLLTAKFDGTMTEEQWVRLSSIRGLLDAIEEGRRHNDF